MTALKSKGTLHPKPQHRIQDWEPLKMKGSILEYQSQQNYFWNNLKIIIYPLASLDNIIKETTKHNCTKQILKGEIQKQQKAELLKRKMKKNTKTFIFNLIIILAIMRKFKLFSLLFCLLNYLINMMIHKRKQKAINSKSQRKLIEIDMSLDLKDICETSIKTPKTYVQ